ncbi:MAG: 2-oxo acid dehydrogenase subunit E2 [Bacteroidales bacterium]|nr:2-oxo acid dehydrogenase subunit E2 [Bacteroidales bacterium]
MDFALPPVGEGLLEVELVRWLVQPGDKVRRGQPLLEVMSDKATMEVPSPFLGTVQATLAEAGAKIQVGQTILRYEAKATSSPSEAAPIHPATEPTATVTPAATILGPSPASSGPAVVAAPSVRHLARKLGVDLTQVHGSGPAGRILLDDLTAFLHRPAPEATPTKPNREPHPMEFGTAGTRQKMAGLRRTIAERMVESERSIPHYSYIDECDVSDLVRVRNQLKEVFATHGLKLTYLPFLVKAVARALQEVPIANSTYDEAAGEIVLHDHYHIGIAVATPAGLIVPVIKNADTLDLPAITAEIERLSTDARNGKARIDDLRGGTFTITSVGSIGGLISTPIINRPEVGILGIGKVVRRPVYDASGNIHPADLIYLSFSFDHRIIDGAVGAAFGNAVIRHLQHPAALLLPAKVRS